MGLIAKQEGIQPHASGNRAETANCLNWNARPRNARQHITKNRTATPFKGFLFFFNPAANILLRAAEPTAVPGSGRLSVLFTPWGCVSVVCFGSAAAWVFGFFGFGAWLALGSSSSASPAWNARTCVHFRGGHRSDPVSSGSSSSSPGSSTSLSPPSAWAC